MIVDDTGREQYLWVEKYRPRMISDCILPEQTKKMFQGIVDAGEIPNLLLSGGPGVGKTTVARALCNQVGSSYIIINGSEESGIDVLRTKIKSYASSLSFDGKRKSIILDEADYLNPQSTQPALRGCIEEFAKNCAFIFTCNYKNRILPALHSRCSVIDFRCGKDEKKQLIQELFNRIKYILDTEGVKYNKKVVVELVVRYFPDFRRLINELQKFSYTYGSIDEGILSQNSELQMDKLFRALKDKKFTDVRQWVVVSLDNDPTQVYRKIVDSATKYVAPSTIPALIVLVGDYLLKSAFSADQELTLLAFFVEFMSECEFV